MLGNVAHIFNSDVFPLGTQEGKIFWTSPKKCSDYYPFGLTMPGRSSNSANPNDDYKFTGHELDDEAGLDIYYMGARYSDPILGGRFYSIDPLAREFPNISPYAYGNNNPLRFTDPTGMAPEECCLLQTLGGLAASGMSIRNSMRDKSLEFKYSGSGSVGLQAGLELDKVAGVEANAGSIELYSFEATLTISLDDFSITTSASTETAESGHNSEEFTVTQGSGWDFLGLGSDSSTEIRVQKDGAPNQIGNFSIIEHTTTEGTNLGPLRSETTRDKNTNTSTTRRSLGTGIGGAFIFGGNLDFSGSIIDDKN